uniref:CSON013938 protein n=1 Tax=Culicoides sonorensis TaxID=179676 RepID=A0A336MEV8_CULSO
MIFLIIIIYFYSLTINFTTLSTVILKRPNRNPKYHWTVLPSTDSLDVCNNQICENNEIHTMCRVINRTSSDCGGFSMLPMDFKNQQKFVLMHNGLRNRIARTKKDFVMNMNYLHWDPDLAQMASNWVRQCRIYEKDSCDFICK